MASDPSGADGPDTRARAEQDMERMLAAALTLLVDLEHHVAVNRDILEGMRRHENLGEVLDRSGSGALRRRLTESLTAYERSRHRARLRLIALGIEEGMTLAEIQDRWAITRQLAQRAMRDIAELD
jgi:hypothetical protein